MNEIAIFLFGAITTSIPLIIWYLRMLGTKYVAECEKTKAELDKTLIDLNLLHNSAVQKYNSLDGRLIKLETEAQALRYGKQMK